MRMKEEKMNYKLITFDMDGTLLNSEKQISKRTLEAIAYATSHNKIVVLCTGRALPELREYLPAVKGVRYIICLSGGYVYDTIEKHCIYSNALLTKDVKKILEVSKQEDCMVHFLNEFSIVNKEDVKHMDHFHMTDYQPLFERVATMMDDVYAYYETYKPEIIKLNLYHSSATGRENTIKRLSNVDIEAVKAETASLECTNKGVTKGVGLLQLCRHLSIDLKETISVGDADNDIEVLNIAGLSIAMGNANQRVKEICDVIVSDHNHDGCVEAIFDYLM